MQKATSAYAKNEDPKTGETAVEFLEKSEVMFLNEKRTARLLRSMSLLTPIELSQSGSIGSIEYIGRKVKLNGVPFKQVVHPIELLSTVSRLTYPRILQFRAFSTSVIARLPGLGFSIIH